MATAVAAWPTSINVTNFSDYGETWDTNFAEFAPDVGPPKRRRRMSLSSETLSPVMYLTSAEVETFRTFYRDTLKDGTLAFTFPKPRTGVIEQYTFTGNAPQVKFADYGLYQVSMTWRSVPNTRASWLPLLTVGSALIPSLAPTTFADFTTEGSTDPHYWYSGNRYASFATWLAAMGGTYVRGTNATYFTQAGLQTAASGIPRFPTDGSGNKTGIRLSSGVAEKCLWNRDLTNAAWTVNLITRTKNQTGIDNVANSATLLTATGANGAIGQTVTIASALFTMGLWVKRITGTGTILISVDGGVTTTSIVPTASWQFFKIAAAQTLANPQALIKIVTNGDAIAVDFVTVRTIVSINNVVDNIATTTTAITQNADVLSFPQTLTAFAAFVQSINQVDIGNNGRVVSLNDVGETGMFSNSNISFPCFGWWNGTGSILGSTLASSMASKHKGMVTGSGSLSTGLLCADGITPVTITEPFEPNTHTLMLIGTDVSGAAAFNGDMQQFALWDGIVAASADLVRLTT